jgi:hypothetical protein
MADVLHFTLPEQNLYSAFGTLQKQLIQKDKSCGYQLLAANALWGQKGEPFLKEFLDLTAVKNGLKIAIEFDTGIRVKFKSVEKLLEVDAEMCIAIVKGGANALESNVNRIEEIRKELGCSKNNLWLMVLSEGKACKA